MTGCFSKECLERRRKSHVSRFDIVIAFVVLVIAVVVIKYALILGAAVLAVLWNGVVIL